MIKKYKNIESMFLELCGILKPKLNAVDNAMEYVRVGEYGLALEFVSDWCVDAEPAIRLTTRELLKIKEVGRHVGKEHLWIELLPILSHSEMNTFPKELLNNVDAYVEQQLINNPKRMEWMTKITRRIKAIETSV